MARLSETMALRGASEARDAENRGAVRHAAYLYTHAAIDANRAGLHRLAKVWRAKADTLNRKADGVRG